MLVQMALLVQNYALEDRLAPAASWRSRPARVGRSRVPQRIWWPSRVHVDGVDGDDDGFTTTILLPRRLANQADAGRGRASRAGAGRPDGRGCERRRRALAQFLVPVSLSRSGTLPAGARQFVRVKVSAPGLGSGVPAAFMESCSGCGWCCCLGAVAAVGPARPVTHKPSRSTGPACRGPSGEGSKESSPSRSRGRPRSRRKWAALQRLVDRDRGTARARTTKGVRPLRAAAWSHDRVTAAGRTGSPTTTRRTRMPGDLDGSRGSVRTASSTRRAVPSRKF